MGSVTRAVDQELHHSEGNVAARTAGRVRACHEMPMCELGVTNTKADQDHLSVSGLLGGGTPSFDGGLNQGQLIAGSQAGIPTGLPRLTDCSSDRKIEFLKEQGKGIGGQIKTGPVWPRDPSFHCQAVPHGMGLSRNKLLCGGSEVRPISAVFSRPEHAGCITSRGHEGHCENPNR